jgi:hypothetical protein
VKIEILLESTSRAKAVFSSLVQKLVEEVASLQFPVFWEEEG